VQLRETGSSLNRISRNLARKSPVRGLLRTSDLTETAPNNAQEGVPGTDATLKNLSRFDRRVLGHIKPKTKIRE
jgi:hypothetical protein